MTERFLPTGLGATLNQERSILRVLPVKAKVIWTNNNFRIPFDLKTFPWSQLTKTQTGFPLEVSREHWRSGLVGRIIIADNDGRLYRDLDMKGIGLVKYDEKKEKFSCGEIAEDETTLRGLCELDCLIHDAKLAEKFTAVGGKTSRTLAIARIFELFMPTGELISVEEAKKRDVIKKERKPAIALRVFSLKTRIADLCGFYASPQKKLLMEDAITLVAQQLGRERATFTANDYLIWFAEEFGKQVGLFRKLGWIHHYLNGHNITLDASIVDFDSVTTRNRSLLSKAEFKDDLAYAFYYLRSLTYALDVKQEEMYDAEELFRHIYTLKVK